MYTNKKTANIAGFAATVLVGTAFAFASAPAAHASEVIARDQAGVVVAQDQSSKLTAEPTAPRAVTVTTEPGTVVTLAPKGTRATTNAQQTRKQLANKDGKATFGKLTAGTHYTVTANGQSTTVTPVVKAGKASDLTVTTTDRVDTVDLTWQHRATKAHGAVGYTVTATPAAQDLEPISVEVTGTSAELSGLDPLTLYSFTVTPHNELGDGGLSVARMTRSLADITGLPVPQADSSEPSPQATEPTATAPTPEPQPAPGPAPVPQPSTRTIWVCPTGYDEIDGACTETREYTYTETTQTAPYTYSQNFHQTGWQDGSFTPAPCTFGTYHPNGPQGEGCYVAAGPTGYYTTDKDAPPTGWTDDGSQYTRTVSTKDEAPEGFSDNGTVWIRTTDKIAKVVPA